jgi:hypothetical protein
VVATPTERLEFFDNQRLFASDLQNLEQFNREMRWLHNRTLHQPGVASGFAASGNKGDREVLIRPGYAVDVMGREIVLAADRTLAVPPVAGAPNGSPAVFDLTVAYPSDEELEEVETRQGMCEGQGVVRRREEPSFCWVNVRENEKLAQETQCGLRILLARAEVLNCQLYRPPSVEHRRNARPPSQPYIACGGTDKMVWSKPTRDVLGIHVRAKVDTTAAKFRTSPRYFAHVIGERQFDVDGVAIVLDGFLTVSEPTASGFNLRVLIPTLILFGVDVEIDDVIEAFETTHDWRIEWIGVEG